MRILVLVDRFPELTQTFVANEVTALARAGHRIRLEPSDRGSGGEPAPDPVEVRYRSDDARSRRIADMVWLGIRHPFRTAGDLVRRRRWSREEPVRPLRSLAPAVRRARRAQDTHVHCHFATGAALDGLRVARLLGLPLSVTAHAYDIFLEPRNLIEKLRAADVVTTGCDYNVTHLRSLLEPPDAARVHRVVMGVDAGRFRRTRPLPGGRTVVAVGRLVPKKGFDDLVRAAVLLARAGDDLRVRIIGHGEQRDHLEALAAEVPGVVELLGAQPLDAVREVLEDSDVLAMPSIVAADGDRDSMPVVVKEAMALEVMVVATAEVGLPEVVREPWGRLVPPRDPEALARAIRDVLDLDPALRATAGAAGRRWVLEHANIDREARRLADLLEHAPRPARPRGARHG